MYGKLSCFPCLSSISYPLFVPLLNGRLAFRCVKSLSLPQIYSHAWEHELIVQRAFRTWNATVQLQETASKREHRKPHPLLSAFFGKSCAFMRHLFLFRSVALAGPTPIFPLIQRPFNGALSRLAQPFPEPEWKHLALTTHLTVGFLATFRGRYGAHLHRYGESN